MGAEVFEDNFAGVHWRCRLRVESDPVENGLEVASEKLAKERYFVCIDFRLGYTGQHGVD